MVCCLDITFSTILVLWLIGVLCKRFVAATDHHSKGKFNRGASNESIMKIPEMQALIRKESGRNGLPVDCCPMTKELIEPLGGTNLHGMYVDLYRDGDKAQRFFEYSCRPDVLDKPCRFIERKLQAQSRCVQMYSYTYAIIRAGIPTRKSEKENMEESQPQQQPLLLMIPDNNVISPSWTLGYIRVRSGCSCMLWPKRRKAHGGEDQ